MRKTRVILASAIAVAGLLVGAAVVDAVRTSDVLTAPAMASAEDVQRLQDALSAQGGVGDAQWVDHTLRETLPNFKVSWDGKPGVRIFAATVEGRVHDVRPGSSYHDSVSGDDTIKREELAFDDPDANWRVVVLTVEVLNDFDPEGELPSEIEVALWLDGTTDPEVIRKGFQGQRIFAVLEEPGRLEPPHAYPVARNGALIGVVREDGSLSLPGLDVEEEEYLGGLTTISAIVAAAKEPETVLHISTENGSWVRTD
ncbi:hypothetical protein [Microbacterium sp.]|uniref:hypothetical protein n=1 Tax=Microbacterium sp. TaxID=51671 RepID=UPI0028122FF0|nr:hypothetical protein [Microbacterium sp.]